MSDLRVLVVEDNPLNADLVSALLEGEGHTVEIATDAAAFRERLRGEVPDIVLMDIMLPDADGVTLLAELRARGGWQGVSVLAVTAQALPGDMARFRAAGFQAVLTKPIDTRTFAGTVLAHSARARGDG